MSSWTSYPSIYAMGHKAIKDLFNYEVTVEEKVDGSQFGFGLVECNLDSEGRSVDAVDYVKDGVMYSLKVRSKGGPFFIDAPQGLFRGASETVKRLFNEGLLVPGWTYRGEAVQAPKHNSLVYDRVPKGNVIIYDINKGDQDYLTYDEKAREAERLGLEVVPRLFSGRIETPSALREFFERTSILGGQKIEGVVVKPIEHLFGPDKKLLMGKLVSEAFKEVHRKAWGESNPSKNDVIELLSAEFRTPARWNKAVIHFREEGKLLGEPRDIGPLIKEIPNDILKEEKDYIMEKLFKWAWPQISRGATRGFPEWYKDQLLIAQFEEDHLGVTKDE